MVHLVRESAGAAREPSLSDSLRVQLYLFKAVPQKRGKWGKRGVRKREKRSSMGKHKSANCSLDQRGSFLLFTKKNVIYTKHRRTTQCARVARIQNELTWKKLNHRALQSCWLNECRWPPHSRFTRGGLNQRAINALSFTYFLNVSLICSLIS